MHNNDFVYIDCRLKEKEYKIVKHILKGINNAILSKNDLKFKSKSKIKPKFLYELNLEIHPNSNFYIVF